MTSPTPPPATPVLRARSSSRRSTPKAGQDSKGPGRGDCPSLKPCADVSSTWASAVPLAGRPGGSAKGPTARNAGWRAAKPALPGREGWGQRLGQASPGHWGERGLGPWFVTPESAVNEAAPWARDQCSGRQPGPGPHGGSKSTWQVPGRGTVPGGALYPTQRHFTAREGPRLESEGQRLQLWRGQIWFSR